jgi:CheY-like chemotaxis protein
MDIQMPVMDGLEAMRLIRQRERQDGTERTPIIALTASALENDVRDSLDAGADLHVSKPVKKATLLAAIESVVPAAAAAPPTVPEHDHEVPETDAAHQRRVVA